MGVVKTVIWDAVITFLWVFSSSTLEIFTSIISSFLGVEDSLSTLIIATVFITILVFIFSVIAEALGGASFNITGNASFYAAGIGDDNLISMALRFPAQALGAVGGILAIIKVLPQQYKHMLGGPSLKVDMHSGAITEGVLTFTITFFVLFIVLRGPKSLVLQTWIISIATMGLVVAGSDYTGPSMNPASAFGWAYIDNRHDTFEHMYVYWISPFIGSILGAWVFRFIFPPPVKKEKKA